VLAVGGVGVRADAAAQFPPPPAELLVAGDGVAGVLARDGAGGLGGDAAGCGAVASAASSSDHWSALRAGVPSWNWRIPSPPALNRSAMKPVMAW
jgi:hypothetical protein